MILAKLKLYWWAVAGAAVTIGLAIIRFLWAKNNKLERKLEGAEAKIHHNKVVEEKKKQTSEEFRSRRADLVNELKEKKVSSELENPNEW